MTYCLIFAFISWPSSSKNLKLLSYIWTLKCFSLNISSGGLLFLFQGWRLRIFVQSNIQMLIICSLPHLCLTTREIKLLECRENRDRDCFWVLTWTNTINTQQNNILSLEMLTFSWLSFLSSLIYYYNPGRNVSSISYTWRNEDVKASNFLPKRILMLMCLCRKIGNGN